MTNRAKTVTVVAKRAALAVLIRDGRYLDGNRPLSKRNLAKLVKTSTLMLREWLREDHVEVYEKYYISFLDCVRDSPFSRAPADSRKSIVHLLPDPAKVTADDLGGFER